MLDALFVLPATVRRLRGGAAGAHLDAFAEELCTQGYQPGTIRLYLTAVEHLGRWLRTRGRRGDLADAATVAAFVAHLTHCRCREPYRGKRYFRGGTIAGGVRRFAEFLRRQGVAAPLAPPPHPPIVVEFEQWMRQNRGTAETTLSSYRRVLHAVLAHVQGDAARLDAKQLRAFILARADAGYRRRPASDVKALRMFVRFLAAPGRCAAAHEGAVPTVATWRLATLARYLPPEDIERLIAGCDLASPIGLRDRAILLLLARLGLRAGDVRTLRLDDIDWREGSLRVSGKSRRHARLPLPQEVGDAVLAYLDGARPPTPLPQVFLRHKTPCGPLRPPSISSIVRLALLRARIDAPSYGAHLLRHSAATQMLQGGASLEQIQAALRHASLETTAIYAKVDTAALSTIAQPWPEAL
jgi:integrase/recombinase XerD